MNWNNTQFDGFDPITLRAARQVGKILKYIPIGDKMQPRYSFYLESTGNCHWFVEHFSEQGMLNLCSGPKLYRIVAAKFHRGRIEARLRRNLPANRDFGRLQTPPPFAAAKGRATRRSVLLAQEPQVRNAPLLRTLGRRLLEPVHCILFNKTDIAGLAGLQIEVDKIPVPCVSFRSCAMFSHISENIIVVKRFVCY
jgi:hypothetical protein